MDNEKSWPHLGNAYANKDGSFTIVLDRDVAIRLADNVAKPPSTLNAAELQDPRARDAPDQAHGVARLGLSFSAAAESRIAELRVVSPEDMLDHQIHPRQAAPAHRCADPRGRGSVEDRFVRLVGAR